MKILVVDDDEDSRIVLKAALSGAGYTVCSAANGAQALEQARRAAPDMIVSDILMPEMDGYALCRAVKGDRQLRGIPFIFYTATYVEPQDEQLAMDMGASRFIVKPMEPAKFLELVHEVLEQYNKQGLPVPERPRKDTRALDTEHAARLARKLDRKVGQLEVERQALRESESRVRLLLDSTAEAIYGIDLQGRCTFANPACLHMLGHQSPEDLLGRNIHTLIHHTRADGTPYPEKECHICQAFQLDKGIHRDNEVLWRADGSSFPVEYWSYPIHEDGRVIGTVVTFFDITERKRTQEALYRNEKRLARFFEASYEGLFFHDNGTILDVNPATTDIFGYAREETIGRNLLEFVAPESVEEVRKNMQTGGEGPYEVIVLKKDGSRIPVEVHAKTIQRKGRSTRIVALQDITERKAHLQELEHLALYDSLTDLPNRNLFHKRLQQAMATAGDGRDPVAVLVLDLARFKEINDTLGHEHGDKVLQEVTERLKGVVSDADTLARLGGDEFAILLPKAGIAHASAVVQQLQQIMEAPFAVQDMPITVDMRAGLACYPEHGADAALLAQRADVALRIAKETKTHFAVYDPHRDPFSLRRLTLFGELRAAINGNGLEVHYQPKVDMSTGQGHAVEALVRWPHSQQGMVPLDEFIPLAEQTGLIAPLTLWVLQEAARQCRAWSRSGLDLKVAINLSARNLQDPELPARLSEQLHSLGIQPDRITLEITESAIMADPERTFEVLTHLHDMGLALSVDDFGTGYSSLAYLRKLPVAELKIDRSFVSNMAKNENDKIIVRSIIDLAHNLGLRVVAEGVEDRDTWEQLSGLGCDIAQGYYISRPLAPAEITHWLQSRSA